MLDEDVDLTIEVNKAGMHPFSKNGRRAGFTAVAVALFVVTFYLSDYDMTSAGAVAGIPIGLSMALVGINPFGMEIVWHALTDRISKLEV